MALTLEEKLEKALAANEKLAAANAEITAKHKEAMAANKEMLLANKKLADDNADIAKKHEEALNLHSQALAANKKETGPITAIKQATKKEAVQLTGKAVKVDYKEGGNGKARKGILFKAKVPSVTIPGKGVLNEEEFLNDAEAMKFLAEETLVKGSSPFIEEVFE